MCLTTESSGQFLYVGYANGNFQGGSAILEYQIDPATPRLVPPATLAGSSNLASVPIGVVADPRGAYLYVGLGPNPSLGTQVSTTSVYAIGVELSPSPVGTAGGQNPHERTIAMDPQGRFFFDGWGSSEGFLESAPISPADGTATPVRAPVSLGFGNFPLAMLADNTGKFLYVQETAGAYVFAIDPISGALGQPQGPLLGLSFLAPDSAADPQGPYLYSLQPDGIHGFQVDPRSGLLAALPGSPFSVGSAAGLGGLAISGAAVQAVSGPAAGIFPSSANLGGVVIGQSSNTRVVSLTNTGDQLLILSRVGVSGTNPADFGAVANCPLPAALSANATCTISVTFQPAAAGLRQARLNTFDNAAGGTQSIALSGTGVAPEPGMTLVPGSVVFPSTLQGATSAAQSVTVTNSGAATLHISAVSVDPNAGDFAATSGCGGAVPVNASCTISVSFSPIGAGLRTGTVSIADDAPGSPHTVGLSGNGIGPPVTRPGVTVAPSVVAFPTTTLGTAVGSETVTVTSTGNSPVHISSIILGGTNPGDFQMTDSCTPPASYAVHASCILTLIFTPSAAGTRTAEIQIADDAPTPNSVQHIAVTGTANSVLVVGAATGDGLTATVKAGQTATYNLQLVPGFTGSVSLGCSGAPTAATCMAPPSMKVASGIGVPFSVTVATAGAGGLAPFSDLPRFVPPMLLRLVLPVVFWTLAVLAYTLRRTPWRPWGGRVICNGVLAGLTLIAVSGVAGCGGGSTIAQSVPITQPNTTATPPGTYTIILTSTPTATNGAPLTAVPPTQLTLIVN